jgi:tetratricopeptide (TPR) repeat protein
MRFGVFAAGLMIGLTVAPVPAAAQRSRRGFVQPTCEVNKSHYLVNSAVVYLQTAARGRPDEAPRHLNDAHRVLLEAITEKGQDQNGSAWYYLGRYYEQTDDLAGADTAFTRAARLLPDCAADIRDHRRRFWVPLLNAGVSKVRDGDNAGAITAFQQANSIYRAEPPAYYYLGQIYAGMQERDSAVKYFAQALRLSQDSLNAENAQYQDIRNTSAFNIARLYHIAKMYDSAAAWYRRFRKDNPMDPQALTGLASVLQEAGRGDEAIVMYDSVLMMADSMPTLELFHAGVAMFRADRFERAARLFERGLQRNPYYRDALFNLANTYLSLANQVNPDTARSDSTKSRMEAEQRGWGAKMTPIVHRLLEADPASHASLTLLLASYRLEGLQDSALAVAQRRDVMPFDLTVSTFEPTGSGFDVRGIIANRKSEATTVPPLTFDFLDESGKVVASVTVDQQTLAADAVVPFALAPVGEGIAAWRYKVGS